MSKIDIGMHNYGILEGNISVGGIITVKIVSQSYKGKYFLLQKIQKLLSVKLKIGKLIFWLEHN